MHDEDEEDEETTSLIPESSVPKKYPNVPNVPKNVKYNAWTFKKRLKKKHNINDLLQKSKEVAMV